ncbi:phosphotransferase [Vibrio sp. CAU 1672]|uniref:phosphotransferase enzyme family protein n=1 Tax=Vibrio sp. CAU 1672 TaxID=3032594 RepID=UPI0023DC5E99|nr:phosphotransferase [Vibrio sp. CAU 1672]MDF2152572.1 phosphotransferase [Vibrio sp. CAU 1672]
MSKSDRESAIFRTGDLICRPASYWTMTVHQLLNHLYSRGFTACPRAVSIEGGKELLSYLEGDSYNYPLHGPIASLNALKSAAKILRQLHDASEDFLTEHRDEVLHWMLPERAPREVICHGDFMPYNVVLKDDEVVGVFDFDTAHPAPRIWDIALSVYGWAPFKTDTNDRLGTLPQQIIRAKIFCDSYGCSRLQREELVDMMTLRLTALVDYIRQQAVSGDGQFVANVAQGHDSAYLKDIEYLRRHREAITLGLLGRLG